MCDHCVSAAGKTGLSRRGLFAAGAGLALAGALSTPVRAQSTVVGADEALKRLVDGNARYVAGTLNERDFSAGRAARAASQAPFASILSCADSRIAPELAFDQGPGQLFVTRVAGNFVNEDVLASLEYGAQVLGSQLILVLGHSNCGAVSATINVVKEKTQLPGHLPSLINAIRPAVLAAQKEGAADLLKAATIANVRLNVAKLKKATPILSQRLAQKQLSVVGGVYDLATGKVELV
ncbi:MULTISPECIES: carbonic anhydrase [unclassified Bosea (in: a-proteobacteria)]|uniref:carbonic anhydrase n=1 Tax=unclassified Bosea (in: a-proteobacteria) TaxID=2653178 RepID=UPI000F74FC80|nr:MULTISPECIES: carbonic anhydrase [unclassified Bosea (in: a-proteobacteria)]AZO79807.1 carbonic anhydrase [Bosea sp. Tri-49]RXT15938.1 carbonic anhydrase [Bosea sp. Tri-39]RXT39629.1 carbonic anhydrase [Bosea sp. Tri-54]